MLPAIELTVLLALLVGGAALLDLRSGRIANEYLLVIAGLGLLAQATAGGPLEGTLRSLAGVGTGLAIWLAFFAIRWVGAGDVKLVGAIGAWLGPLATVEVSFFTALAGGALSLGYAALRRTPLALGSLHAQLVSLRTAGWSLPPAGARREGAADRGSRQGMPYAVAILAGLLIRLYVVG